jgi:hypothetical protein
MTTTNTMEVGVREQTTLNFDEMLTPKEVGQELGLTTQAIYKAIERGHLNAYQKRPRALQYYLLPSEVRAYYGTAASGRW